MGSRVEGKMKLKAAKKVTVTAKFNSKRKLSRFGKKGKKGEQTGHLKSRSVKITKPIVKDSTDVKV